jgi:glycosyltransferase involved in cell wall biosynthesis
MKIVYLTWGETPRSYGVFGTQVLGQFVGTAALDDKNEYHFISAVPIVHSGLIREKWWYLKEIVNVKKKLNKIKFHWLSIWCTQNFTNSNRFGFGLMHGISHNIFAKKLIKLMPNIIHCRSYHAAWAAVSVRKKYNLKYKIIFDARGLWPEEVALKKGWSNDSTDYKYLKNIEKIILEECECSISVSDNMHDYFLQNGSRNDQVIYLSADADVLKISPSERIQSDVVRFVYVGALAENTWHKPQVLADLYDYLSGVHPKTKLTIVTTSDHGKLKKYFSKFNDKEIIFTSAITRDDLKNILKNQDVGLMTYFEPSTKREHLLASMVLAVKTAEYFMAGLPMICNKYCGGAARIISENQLGYSYGSDDFSKLTFDNILSLLSSEKRKSCQDFAEKNFNYISNGYKYLNIYKSLDLND